MKLLAMVALGCAGETGSSTGGPAGAPPADSSEPAGATGVPPGCEVEDGWDLGGGWCPVTFAATLQDDGPADLLQVVLTASWSSGEEVVYVGPVTSERFEWPDAPVRQDDTTRFRLEVTDPDGLTGDCEDAMWVGELFVQGDSDDDGHGGFDDHSDDCDECDPTVYVGAPELVDGLDNDCDGTIDG